MTIPVICKKSQDRASILQKKETLFTVDSRSGKLLGVLDPTRAKNTLPEINDIDRVTYPQNDLLYIKRTDNTLMTFSLIQNTLLWNLTFSTIEAISRDQEKEPQVNVVHFRYSPHVDFIQFLKPKDAKPSLPRGDNENSTLLLESGNRSLFVGGNRGPNNITLFNTRMTVKMIAGAVVCFLVVFILLCASTITVTKQKSSNELVGSDGKNTSVPKRKKGRKVANVKNGANTQKNGESILFGDLENINGMSSDKRIGKNPWPSPGIHLGANANGRMIGKLYISCTEIARGSNGTVVMEGIYDGRPVAVKRLVRAHHDVAHKEVQNLIAADQHPNIVRYYGVEYDSDFVYLSLERCSCTLGDLIKICSESSNHLVSNRGKSLISAQEYSVQLGVAKENYKNIGLWKANKYPSAELLRLMRDVVSGLEHLHELGIIHRDLKPQNILIINGKSLCAKLSDMGISKRLLEDKSSLDCHFTGYGSSGWQAPEQLLHGRQTRAMDLFSLGCVLFFCITGGKHPYGDHLERDINIVKNRIDFFLVDDIPEAVDLFSHLLDPNPELRPTATCVLRHPLFWSSETRLSFLRDVSDRVELEDREVYSDILKALENIGPVALGGNWDEKMETKFIDNIGHYRRYKFNSIRDLLRVIRNKLNHYRELPNEIQEILGPVPDGFDAYFSSRIPKLLIEVYKVIYRYCTEEECFRKYFQGI